MTGKGRWCLLAAMLWLPTMGVALGGNASEARRQAESSMLVTDSVGIGEGGSVLAHEVDPKIVAFRAEARVELDAAGRPTKIEASKDLPDAIRSYVEGRVAAYHFSPPARDGVSGPAVTHLSLGACAVPSAGGYRLGLDLQGYGPRLARLGNPEYPREAARAHVQAQATMRVLVRADGTAALEKIEYADPEQPARRAFDGAIGHLVSQLRFEPEQLAGQPVATRIELGANFVLPGDKNTRELKDQLQRKYAMTRECQDAGADTGQQPIALDSPVAVTPTSG